MKNSDSKSSYAMLLAQNLKQDIVTLNTGIGFVNLRSFRTLATIKIRAAQLDIELSTVAATDPNGNTEYQIDGVESNGLLTRLEAIENNISALNTDTLLTRLEAIETRLTAIESHTHNYVDTVTQHTADGTGTQTAYTKTTGGVN